MKKMILMFVLLLGFCSLSAKEQMIEIKVSGGAEREVLGKDDKPTGEKFIGYSTISTKQGNPYTNITFAATGEGWEPIKLVSVTVKCAYEDLLKLAFSKIKKGVTKGTFSDEITEGKKKFTRTVKWNSTGLYKSSKITIILDNDD